VPAVEPVPWTVPDVPWSLDDAVFVLLLPLLQPNTSAAASASPYTYFILRLLKGLFAALGSRCAARREVPAAPQR